MTTYNVQPTYSTGIGLVPYVVGEIVDMQEHNVITRNVETAAGITFGKACSNGVADLGCVIGGGAKFRGISVRDITLDPSLAASFTPDIYPQNSSAALLTMGMIAVKNDDAAQVVPGDPVYANNTTGVLSKTATGATAIAGAQWQTTTAAGAVGVIKLGIMT